MGTESASRADAARSAGGRPASKIRAVLELVKNADAPDYTVVFYGRESGGKTAVYKIAVEDSGVGMTRADVLGKLAGRAPPDRLPSGAVPRRDPKLGRFDGTIFSAGNTTAPAALVLKMAESGETAKDGATGEAHRAR